MAKHRDKVLVVESVEKIARDVARELRDRSLEVFTASDAVSALVEARKIKPDVALINSRLAGGGGMSALKRIRSNVYTAHIPIVITLHRGASGQEFLAAGAQECLAPPLSTDAILAALQRHVLKPLDFTQAPAEVIANPDRLAALRETGLLDSPPEETFDRLTRLAARLLGAGTALVSLVDKDRQFFKSQVGLAQPWAGARQTRLSHSFCQWVVSGGEQLVVKNANEIPALRANLAVKDLGVIAYAGVPLSGRGGQVIGSFCALHCKPRAWSAQDMETLSDLSQISEAYAVIDQTRRGIGVASPDALTNLETSIHAAGKAIVCAGRILRRYGTRLEEADRADLLAIIEEQGRHLERLAPDLSRPPIG